MKNSETKLSGRTVKVRVERLVETKDKKYKVNVAQPVMISADAPGMEGKSLLLEPDKEYELPAEVADTLGNLVKRI
jgi:hypothetical protein